MAMRFLQECDARLDVHSAGTHPAGQVNPYAIRVMEELGISMQGTWPKPIDRYLDKQWDYVITVCDHARESCPVFTGRVSHCLHLGFPDPALATGTESEITETFRQVRNEIQQVVTRFYAQELKQQ